MKKVEKMEYILAVVSRSEKCTKADACKSCVERNIVYDEEEFEEAIQKLLNKKCLTYNSETDVLTFKKPYSFLHQKGSVNYNGTTDRTFYCPPNGPGPSR